MIRCELCGVEMKMRINGSHLKRVHNLTIAEYREQFPDADCGEYAIDNFTCKVCGETTSGNSEVKGAHLRKAHGLDIHEYNKEYEIKYCLCGCGNICDYSKSKYRYNLYVRGHHFIVRSRNKKPRKARSESLGYSSFIGPLDPNKPKCTTVWNKGFTKETSPVLAKCFENWIPWTGRPGYEEKRKLMGIKVSEARKNDPSINERMVINYKKRMQENYGVDNYFQTDAFKEYMVNYNLENYGVPHRIQDPEFFLKVETKMRKFKDYVCPSGAIRRIQGFEDLALDILFKSYPESDIIDDKRNIPAFWYESKGTKHRYYPDLYIISEHKIIEVKSSWTLKLEHAFELKKNSVIDSGYDYEVWVFENRRNKKLNILKYARNTAA